MTFWNFVYFVAGIVLGYNFGGPIVQFVKDFIEGLK